MFRANILPPSSDWKCETKKKPKSAKLRMSLASVFFFLGLVYTGKQFFLSIAFIRKFCHI
jgi:hypothetical protein